MKVLAIDPNPDKYTWVLWDSDKTEVIKKGNTPVKELINTSGGELDEIVSEHEPDLVAIEAIQSYGSPIGRSTIITCMNIGRLIFELEISKCKNIKLYARPTIKGHFQAKKDPDVRRALMIKYGDPNNTSNRPKKGEKLFGIVKDLWAALAIAVAVSENPKLQEW